MTEEEYLAQTAATRPQRLRWWQQARFGTPSTGLYAQLGRHEWVIEPRAHPIAEYEKLADSWKPRSARRASGQTGQAC